MLDRNRRKTMTTEYIIRNISIGICHLCGQCRSEYGVHQGMEYSRPNASTYKHKWDRLYGGDHAMLCRACKGSMIHRTNNATYNELLIKTLPPAGPLEKDCWRKIADLVFIVFMINSSNERGTIFLVFDIYNICNGIWKVANNHKDQMLGTGVPRALVPGS